jgi:cytochrome c-type biogenesis protein CcmF
LFGKILIHTIFLISLITSGLFIVSYRKSDKYLSLARKLFYGLLIGIIVVSGFFLSNIFSHDFQFTYIWENSSRTLPWYLLLASFFSGQQGSILLWLLIFAIFGFILVPNSRRYGFENLALSLFSVIMAFFLLIIIFKSPFEYIWETYKVSGFNPGFTPLDGKGLNPILENIWITIHPPVLFAGYAAAAIPFIFAIVGLIQKEYKKWLEAAYPWVLLACSLLGFGIMLGGFWAYETLGWGGFWAWDPVENSSLLPWLSSIALIHTMIIQRKTNRLIKTNFFLAVFSFILVLYATFLTRSGILGSASVHSFTDPGASVYYLLISMLIIFIIAGIITLSLRVKDIKSIKSKLHFSSREYFLAAGSLLLLISTFIIMFGTSWPLISEFFGKKSIIDTNSYNLWNLPLIILVMISNGVSLYLNWKKTDFKTIQKQIKTAMILTTISTVIIILLGVYPIQFILLTASIFFSLFVNLQFALHNFRKYPFKIGGNISHIGLSVLMMGIMTSGSLNSTAHIQLKRGEKNNVLGHNLTFIDKVALDKELTDRQKFGYKINIENSGELSTILPIVYWSDFNERKAPIIEPGIKRYLTHDLYISIKSAEVNSQIPTLSVLKNEKNNFLIDSAISFELIGYDMRHIKIEDKNEALFGGIVKYSIPTKERGFGKIVEITDTLFTRMGNSSVYTDIIWKKVPNTNIDISFYRLIPSSEDMSKSRAIFAFKKSDEPYKEPEEIISCEISKKPFINLVWAGVLMIVGGFLVAIINNLKTKEK